jgi:hypothetical protein
VELVVGQVAHELGVVPDPVHRAEPELNPAIQGPVPRLDEEGHGGTIGDRSTAQAPEEPEVAQRPRCLPGNSGPGGPPVPSGRSPWYRNPPATNCRSPESNWRVTVRSSRVRRTTAPRIPNSPISCRGRLFGAIYGGDGDGREIPPVALSGHSLP